MEQRDDLADVLLTGLPGDERDYVLEVIGEHDAEVLRHKRAAESRFDGDNAAETDDAPAIDPNGAIS